jgi:hypothetical protein
MNKPEDLNYSGAELAEDATASERVAAEAKVEFNIKRPFRTRCGWPARLVGVLQRRSNPYVVAVWNPNYNSEELHAYPQDGGFPSQVGIPDTHPLDLLEIPDDDYWAWRAPPKGQVESHVHAFVTKEPNWPANANVMRLDHWSMCTPLVRGWDILHEGYDNEKEPRPLTQMKFYNQRTGDVFVLHFTPMDQRELENQNGN